MSYTNASKPALSTPKKRPKSALSAESTPISKLDVSQHEITVISHFGDIVLDVSKEGGKEHVLVKVDSIKLKNVSNYFSALLDPDGFLEGRSILQQRERLQEAYPKASDIPDEDLPRIMIIDIGQTSALKSIKPLVVDFLRVLHGYDIQRALKNPPPVNIANLAVLADRFDAKESVSTWAQSKPNVLPKIHAALPIYDEEIYRQRLLTCLFLGNETRLATYSSHLILQGSVMWRNQVPQDNSAMWWDLPRAVEEELQSRRGYIIETILSLQDYLLGLYTSRHRQCKLGYDSSPQCDSFQLGEFVKFLTRIGTLRLQGAPSDSDEPDIVTGDLRTTIKDLRACPAYQVDTNHSHCGPKKQLLAGLDYIESKLGEYHVGICFKCWKDPNHENFWSNAKRLPFFSTVTSGGYQGQRGVRGCERGPIHDSARDFFMAVDRGWQTLLYGR